MNLLIHSSIESFSNQSSNYQGTNQYSNDWYVKSLSNGDQVYSYINNGTIKGAGYNTKYKDLVKTKSLKK